MRNFLRHLRQTFTVARRDFLATVFTPAFLLFLLTPVIMIGFALIGGFGAQSVVGSGEARQRIVVIAAPDRAATVTEIDKQFRSLFPPVGDNSRPALRIDAPGRDVAAQARALFREQSVDVSAVLFGPLEKPTILRGTRGWNDAKYLAQLAEQTLRAERAGGPARQSFPDIQVVSREQASSSGKGFVAYLAVLGIFFLTLLLSGQAVGTMAEEKSNKVIEVLAAAVPLESVFLGKLIGMFGVATLFIAFWGTLLGNLPRLLPAQFVGNLAELGAAVGYPAFPLLVAAYFTTSYMLFSALFLGVGALASTQREIQMLALPITVLMMGMFGFSLVAISSSNQWLALAAEIFPFSSPMAMAGRAAHSPELWPHAVALAWQALWVGVVVTVGARTFRRGVLKSGSPRMRPKGRKPPHY
jgi:ABC-2 type transport system permease protein